MKWDKNGRTVGIGATLGFCLRASIAPVIVVMCCFDVLGSRSSTDLVIVGSVVEESVVVEWEEEEDEGGRGKE